MSVKVEFGDFQTPDDLCGRICEILTGLRIAPASIVEPTCGKGAFLRAAVQAFPECKRILGFEINPDYVQSAAMDRALVCQTDFFQHNWDLTLGSLPDPLLVMGNPPWVTNAAIEILNGPNLPAKSNFRKLNGVDAITGKSNFDISEWMLSHLLALLSGRTAALAMLCKTTVARKVLQRAWKTRLQIKEAALWSIDAAQYFGAAVDACLLVCLFAPGATSRKCWIFPDLESHSPLSAFGLHNGKLVANAKAAERYGHLHGHSDPDFQWRSGVKHDCARIMELRSVGGVLENGLGERVRLEPDFLYPMLKSSGLMKPDVIPSRHMLVTQRAVGEDTERIRRQAPQTWAYLESHAEYLDGRKSRIYRNRPRFSLFGVGHYTFAPWKVAVSGLYKHLRFRVVGPVEGKPVVLDDTCYFLSFQSKAEAEAVREMLDSDVARRFFHAYIFWDAKRPVTIGILGSLNLKALSDHLGVPLPMPYG